MGDLAMRKPTSNVAYKPHHSRRSWAIALAGAVVLAGGAIAATAPLTQPSAPPDAPFRIEEIADLDQPWAMTLSARDSSSFCSESSILFMRIGNVPAEFLADCTTGASEWGTIFVKVTRDST